MPDTVRTFKKNFLSHPEGDILRNVGLELEFPVVKSDGAAVEYRTILKLFSWLEKRGWEITTDTGTGEIVEVSKSVKNSHGRFGFDRIVIGTDVGYCTLEVALSPHNNLFAAEECWNSIKSLLLEFFSKEHCHLLGYGIQPITPPTRSLVANKGRYAFFEQDSLNRVIDQRSGKDLSVFAITASNQCHVDVYEDEAISAVNMMNGIAPLLSAITANSSVWQGKVDPEWTDIREIFWDKAWSNRIEQTGIPEPFADFSDYVDRLSRFRPLMVKRGDEYVKILDRTTFGDFLDTSGESAGQSADGASVRLQSKPEDILFQSGFAWWQARLAPSYGTLELRPCSQQPENATFSVAALALGLLENMQDSLDLYHKQTVGEWRTLRFDTLRHGLLSTIYDRPVATLVKQMLHIAKKGLIKRGLGEEKFLNALDDRMQKNRTVSDEVSAVFNVHDLSPFFDLVEIRGNV